MNILVVSPQIYPCVIGGVEVFNLYFIKELAARGHKIWVLTTCNHSFNNKNIIQVKISQRMLLHSSISINFQILYYLVLFGKKIDIYHVPYTSNSPFAYPFLIAKKIRGILYIITIHGGGMHPWRRKRLQKLFFQYASGLVAVSTPIRQEYEKRTCRKISLIPPLIPFNTEKSSKNELRLKYGFNINDKIILSLGSIKRIKGNDILLESFIHLGKEYIKKNSTKLIFVGDGPLRYSLEKRITEEKLNEYVKFIGKVPYENVCQFYRLSDIYVISSFFEGMPVSLLEAMFNGLAIIGTNVDGINSIISHQQNGLLSPKGDIFCLSNNLKIFIDNEDLRVKLGNSAKKSYLDNFAFEYAVSSHINLYKNIMGENK